MAFEYSFRRPDCSHLRKLLATTLQLSEVTQQAMLNKQNCDEKAIAEPGGVETGVVPAT